MDDLLQPSLQNQQKVLFNPPPFSARAQYIVTFFGGVAAGWYFSYLNTQRLKTDDKTLKQVSSVWLGASALVLLAIFIVATQVDLSVLSANDEAQRYIRYGNRILAVIVSLYIDRLQRPWYSRYHLLQSDNQEKEYASPWVSGLIAIFLVSIPFGLATAAALFAGNAFNGG